MKKWQKLIPKQKFINQMPGLWVALDLQSRFIQANKVALEWTGFSSFDYMIEKTYFDMPCKASEQHENFIQQDKIILQNKGHGKIFGLYCYDNDIWKIILAEKYPIKDDNENVVGLISYISDLTYCNIVDVNKFVSLTSNFKQVKLQQTGYIVDANIAPIELSSRQSECLFFLLRGKSAKDIAKILFLSSRTIEMYIDQLKAIFQCQNKSELLEKAISLGYMNHLPKSLFDLFKS